MDEKKVRDAIETIKSNYPTSGYYMLWGDYTKES